MLLLLRSSCETLIPHVVIMFSELPYARMHFSATCVVSILPAMFQLVYMYREQKILSNQRVRLNDTIFDEYEKHFGNKSLQNLTYYEREIILKEYLLESKGLGRYDATVRPVREMETRINVTMVYELYGMLLYMAITM